MVHPHIPQNACFFWFIPENSIVQHTLQENFCVSFNAKSEHGLIACYEKSLVQVVGKQHLADAISAI